VHHSFDTATETINDWQNVTRFVNINISQGSVGTRLRWGGIFINYFIPAHALSYSAVKLFSKNSNLCTWARYRYLKCVTDRGVYRGGLGG